MVIDGKKLNEEILYELIEIRKNFGNITLAVIAVGDISDNLAFIKAKENFAKKLDVDFKIYELLESLSRNKLRKRISQIVKAKTINGAIIQLPLPSKFPTQYFLNSIVPEKDIDCLCSQNTGRFFTSTPILGVGVNPPAVEVVDFLKEKFKLDFVGKFAVIVGYGNLVGKPISHYLLRQKATIAVINSKTSESVKENLLNEADIIISGVGQKNIIANCKRGAVLIDFGYSIASGKMFGDINFEKIKDKASLITPTPGGTGPILVAMLYKNLLELTKLQKAK